MPFLAKPVMPDITDDRGCIVLDISDPVIVTDDGVVVSKNAMRSLIEERFI